MYLYVKAAHIIFIVSWFAGLFYLPRLFIYHTETQENTPEIARVFAAQFQLMEKRLWTIIMGPSMVLTLVTGLTLIYLQPGLLTQSWMQVKLFFVALLLVYHYGTFRLYRSFQKGQLPLSSHKLRLWNEGATLILISIVFLVVVKNSLSWVWGMLGLVAFGGVLLVATRLYRLARTKDRIKK